MNETTVINLPRGGYLVNTPAGSVQIGSPPETIKDTMTLPGGVPEIFVLPSEMFSWNKGISIAEIEFPLYYNFFLKKKKTFVICTQAQFERMKTVLQESIFGPLDLDITADYDDSEFDHIPEIKKEMLFFRSGLKLSDIVAFGIFNESGSFTIKGIHIRTDKAGNFEISYEGIKPAIVPGKVEYQPRYSIGERLPEPYLPPLFGVTCLGPSHGFDPDQNTSGFIMWLNHQGIMIDPPVNSAEWLVDSNVNPKLIDSIILTHCHADHDAGTFQKILQEGRVTIYTTETVLRSFINKYSNLSGIDSGYLMKLFDFHPVKIGSPVYIHGGRFMMFYTLHSIPAIGFRMDFQDQSFVYSSDHNNDPELHKKLLDEGVISEARYNHLATLIFDAKVIYHESGVPPLHTPIRYLNSLPSEMQKKIVVYHIARKDFPENTELTLATFGIENTLYFKTSPPEFEKAYQILGILKKLDFFNSMPIAKAQEFLDIVEEERYKKGERIISKGTKGDRFYIIYSGNVSVDSGGLDKNKIYGEYDYFGEVALVTDSKRAADVVAETDVIVYTIPKFKFLNFIVGTEFEKTLKRLARIRSSETWNLLSTSRYFQQYTSTQKTWLESMFIPEERDGRGTIIGSGAPFDRLYIIRNGEVNVIRDGERVAILFKGDFIGTMQEVRTREASQYSYTYNGPVSLYAMTAEDIIDFTEKYPGLVMKLAYDF
jgi:CRP-like cAMP-binding protein